MRAIPFILALFLPAAAIAASPDPLAGPWNSELDVDNPLVGKIWSPANDDFATWSALSAAAAAAPMVLLGEMHTNPDHHRLQAAVIEAMVDAGRRPSIVMEMLDTGRAHEIEAFLASDSASAEGFGEAVEWTQSGWPSWSIYEPIGAAAIGNGLALVPGDLPRDRQRAVSKAGLGVAGDPEVTALAEEGRPHGVLNDALLLELADGHCGMLPEKVLPLMANVQIGRDAAMATAMIRSGTADGSVLIAGAGHVREDRGVPAYLRAAGVDGEIVSVAFLEVVADSADPAEYLRNGDETAYDFVVFTPRIDDIDHCAEFRKSRAGK